MSPSPHSSSAKPGFSPTADPSKRSGRLSSLLPSILTGGRKSQPTEPDAVHDPPLRSLLLPSGPKAGTRPSPTFVEPSVRQRHSLDGSRPRLTGVVTRPPPNTAVVIRPFSVVDRLSRSESVGPHARSGSTSAPRVKPPAPRRANSEPPQSIVSGPATGVWLCSPPTGKRAERPLVVRSVSVRSHESGAVDGTEVMAAYRALGPERTSSPPSRCSLDSDTPQPVFPQSTTPQPQPSLRSLGSMASHSALSLVCVH